MSGPFWPEICLKGLISGLIGQISGLRGLISDLRGQISGLIELRRPGMGRTNDKQPHRLTKVPCVLHDFVPFRAAAQKPGD